MMCYCRARFLRRCDREIHDASYPALYYPELYLLEGGYKAFYELHSGLCTPRHYLPMLQRDHADALRQYRAECKEDSRLVKQNAVRRRVNQENSHKLRHIRL